MWHTCELLKQWSKFLRELFVKEHLCYSMLHAIELDSIGDMGVAERLMAAVLVG